MILPESNEKLTKWAEEIIARCRSSQSARGTMARDLRTWVYTGSPDGNASLLNFLHSHIDRLASYLFSPNDLRFHIDFTHKYGKEILDQAEVASRVLTREFERRDIDQQFGNGVKTSLMLGAVIPKVMMGFGGVSCKVVQPYQFSVYREDKEDFGDQEAFVETNLLTPFDLWRRISHLPDAMTMFKRAMAYAKKRQQGDEADTYLHQVLLAGTPPIVQTSPNSPQQPGGVVNVTANPIGAMMSADVQQEMITFHELWVIDDERQDYTTIQVAEPDILVAPRYKRTNMFVPEYHPYGLIRPNSLDNYFWGRPEIADLMKLQHLLRDRLDDLKKLMSIQYDRLFAFIGDTGITDEAYDNFRQAGWINLPPGADVKDVTPKLPDHAFDDIHEIMKMMEMVSGFQNILSGQGEPGVRAGNHAETLLKTASPRMQDRALLVERQCADFADKVFQLMAAKEAKAYWINEEDEEQEFLLSQLPEDMRITVDSHSSSPIYADKHDQLVAFLLKAGIIDGTSALDLLPVPMRDILQARFIEIQKAKAEQMQELMQHPEMLRAIKGGKK